MSSDSPSAAEACTVDGMVDLDRSVVVAEVYSRTVQAGGEGLVGCYFLLHSMEADEAQRAMDFLRPQPSLIVDVNALVDDSRAEFPALVTIRWSDETRGMLASMHHFGVLRELPYEGAVRQEGLDLFLAHDAIARGLPAPDCAPLAAYDARALRRKVYAARALVVDDRDPWLRRELDNLRRITAGDPEGSEALVARADDMEAALSGRVEIGDGFAVVVPTIVDRVRVVSGIQDWVPQGGREIVVAHGLDAVQAARALALVSADPESFVAKGQLVAGRTARERLGRPRVVRDASLNWISVDLTGRRSGPAYERLRPLVAGASAPSPARGASPAR